MKVHFFDKAGNFLKSDDMEWSRIRKKILVPDRLQPLAVHLERDLETVEPALTMKHKVFKAVEIYGGGEELDRLVYGPQKPLFYLYLEVPQ